MLLGTTSFVFVVFWAGICFGVVRVLSVSESEFVGEKRVNGISNVITLLVD